MNCHASTLLPGTALVGAVGRLALARVLRGLLRRLALLVLVADLAAVAGPGFTEYQLKATFVFNFVKFTDWPSAAFTNVSEPIIIGVAGENPFDQTLDELVAGETVYGRRIAVKRFNRGMDYSACHVLFISRSEKDRLAEMLESLKNKSVLTVSDLDQFCEQGGMINLALSSGGTVQPEINPTVARLAGLQISSRLLNLPTVRLVETTP